jgi:chromosome partitioning protein
MIGAVVNNKGGVGKSTLAINIAIARALQSRDVWLIDCDPTQKSTINAMEVRAQAGIQPTVTLSHFVRGDLLRAQVKHQQEKFDDIIIDCGGTVSGLLLAALTLADVAIAPFQPRTFDVWAMDEFALVVAEARAMRDNLECYAVLNLADPQGKDNEAAARAVAEIEGIKYLDCPIGRRKAIPDAVAGGLSVLEHKPVDHKARAEILRLVDHIFAGSEPKKIQ